MLFKVFEPHEMLKPFIHSIQLMEIDQNEGFNEQKIVPYGLTGLFFNYKGPTIQTDEIHGRRVLPMAFAGGLTDCPILIDGVGSIGMVAFNFYPEGLYHFVRDSMTQITNSTIDLRDIMGDKVGIIQERLAETSDNYAKIELLQQFLIEQLESKRISNNKAVEIAQLKLLASGGNVTIHELIDETGVSISSLERYFREEIGISPKSYAGILRFNNVFKHLKQSAFLKWQDIVYYCGYYDQAHLIREFSRYTGETPRSYFSRMNYSVELYSGK
ncbi:MAG TPA: helix-turn-helix domain-containing protein [Bacteroidales bacterium]|nr:helix-turn-helix domain-containing protein [Bacteroidales bacterium]